MNDSSALLRSVRCELPDWREQSAPDNTRVWRHLQRTVIRLDVSAAIPIDRKIGDEMVIGFDSLEAVPRYLSVDFLRRTCWQSREELRSFSIVATVLHSTGT